MKKAQYGDTSPIAALATGAAPAAIALIRASGEGSIDAVARAFSRPKALKKAPGHTLVHGTFLSEDGQPIDEVLISVFHPPRSFTGEESLEISCHGSPLIAKKILQTLEKLGLRPALPGEFSFRAFANGKIDLTQAEAIMDLVQAPSEISHAMALRRLTGELRAELEEMRSEIVRSLAAAELYLDYSEEDISLAPDEEEVLGRVPHRERLEAILPRLKTLLSSWQRERLWLEGATVVLVGAPNAGKSSLFNYLLREERALISDIPGTTRDWLEAKLVVEGIPLRLIDTAGLRDSEDPIEKAGIARARAVLEEADIVIWLWDSTQEKTAQEESLKALPLKAPHIEVWTKADLMPEAPADYIPISVKTGEGIETLLEKIVLVISKDSALEAGKGASAYQIGIASERQKNLLEDAHNALKTALEMAEESLPLDLIAPQIRRAVEAIATITGEITSDDIFETMFSDFCVGK